MPCYNCDGTEVEVAVTNTTLHGVPPIPHPWMITPSVNHELLTNPAVGAPLPLTNHGGHVIDGGRAKVFTIYMGPMGFSTSDFDAFVKAIVEDGYYLSPDGKDGTPGAFQGSITLPQYPFGPTVDDAQLQPWLTAFIASKGWHADAYTLFALIFPVGTTVTMTENGKVSGSCTAFCGYHSRTPGSIYYSVQCDTACPGCHGSFSPGDSRMMVMAHEYGEWRSDPDGTAWYCDVPGPSQGAENGDECAWKRVAWGPQLQWAVQPLAVNDQGCYVGPYKAPVVTPPPPVGLKVWKLTDPQGVVHTLDEVLGA